MMSDKYIVKANFNGHEYVSEERGLEYAIAISCLIKNKFDVEAKIEKVNK